VAGVSRYQNALKHGRYSKESIEQRRLVRALIKESRKIIELKVFRVSTG
jgi:hypothetical protein